MSMLQKSVRPPMGTTSAVADRGAYVCFAARDGRAGANLIELAGAMAFAAIGLAGLLDNPLLIAGC